MKTRYSLAALVSMLSLFLMVQVPLYAQPGQLVPCFNTGTGFNGNTNSFILLPTGKLLCAGNFTDYNGTPVNRICRLNADGTLDAAFTANVGGGADNEIDCMAVLPNGQILISGFFTSYNGTAKGRIARLNADGTLDATFAIGVGATAGRIHRFAVQTDGKIVIGGGQFLTQYDGVTIRGFARLNADGSLDAAFNSGAASGITPPGGTYDLKIQSDGKILLAGDFTAYKNVTVPKGLIRINTDGSRDMSFNNGGSGASIIVTSMAIQPDGKIVVGLGGTYNGFARNNIARINADGSLDNAFFPLGPNGACDVALQSDGNILVYGSFTTYDGISRNNIARANSNGTIDLTFNPTGSNAAITSCFVFPDSTAVLGSIVGFTTYNGTSAINIARIQLSSPVTISGTSPVRNSNTAALSTPLTLNFTQSMNAATASQSAFRVWGGMSGLRSGTYSGGGSPTISFSPAKPYSPGELVSATLMCGAQSSIGTPASPQVMQFRAQAGVGPGIFQAGQTFFPPFTNAQKPILADLNNDGRLDIVVPDETGANKIHIFFAGVGGVFSATPSLVLNTAAPPKNIAAADFNNDGIIDIAAVNYGANQTIEIWIPPTPGAYSTMMANFTITGGCLGARNITVGDVNGDGNMDIVSGCSNSDNINVWLGNGNGTFLTAVAYSSGVGGGFINDIALGDFDNDGDIDAICTNDMSSSIRIMFNQGNGTFFVTANIASGINYHTLALADFNDDGNLDIAVSDYGINNVHIFRGNGNGTFLAADSYPAGNNIRGLVAGDFNGDGRMDLAVADYVGQEKLNILLRNSASYVTGAAFASVVSTPSNCVFATHNLAAGDIDGDGDLDILMQGTNVALHINSLPVNLVTTNPTRNSNTSTPTSLTIGWNQPMTSATASLPAPASLSHSLYAWGSMTGYRALPSLGSATQSGNTTVFTPTKPFRPGELVSLTVKDARATSGVQAKPVVYDFKTKAGVGPATFYQTSTPIVGVDARTTATGDFDGDGDLDIAVGSPSQVDILLNDGTGTFTTGSQISSGALGGLNPWTVTAGDFNNDGAIDLAVTGTGGSSAVYILLNNANGTGTFAVSSNYVTGITQCWHLTSADIDGDGDLDLLVANTTGNTVNILLEFFQKSLSWRL